MLKYYQKEGVTMSFKKYMKEATLSPEEGDVIEYLNIRGRLLSNVLVNAQRDIPSVACTYDRDITAFYETYKELKETADYRLTFNSLMLKVLTEGLKSAPKLNAHSEYNHRKTSGRLIIKKNIDVAMAVRLQNGETFQVKLKGLQDKSLREICKEAEDVKAKLHNTNMRRVLFNLAGKRMVGYAAKGKIITTLSQFVSAYFGKGKIAKFGKLFRKKYYTSSQPKKKDTLKVDDFSEGTVCFTNWGTLYDGLDVNITYIPPLYPQVFLFGTGKIKEVKDVYKKDDGTLDIAYKKILPVTLVFDHKIGGAADLVPFIERLDKIFENPEIIKEW